MSSRDAKARSGAGASGPGAPEAPDRRSLLSRISVFSTLEPGDLETIAAYAVPKRFPAKSELFHKGDVGTEAYGIVSGRLKVVTESNDGKEAILSIMGEGEVFGEVAMLCGGRRSATVATLDPSELLVLHRRDMLAVFDRHPRIAVQCLAALAERLIHITERMEDAVFLGLPARLARRLVALADRYGDEGPEGVTIDLRLSQTDLGNLVGTSRESVNKTIKAWERDGWLRHDRGVVVIRDREALDRLAELVEL